MSPPSKPRSRLGWLIALLIAFHTLLAYGLPPAFPLGVTLLLGVVFWRVGTGNALLTAFSMLFATLLYGTALWITGVDQTVYARAHDLLTDYDYDYGHKAYRKNQISEMPVRQGDLQAMTRQALPTDSRRPSLFQTDSFGFRNSRDYHGQGWALVGDSFIAGVSVSQEELLGEQLLRDYGIDTYSLGHPGHPGDYQRYVEGLAARAGRPFRIALFLFEGNDFTGKEENDSSMDLVGRKVETGYKRYLRLFSDTNVYRFTSSMYKKLRYREQVQSGEQVRVAEVGGRPAAFYQLYVDASQAEAFEPTPTLLPQLEAMAPWLGEVYFIPTKYRVYQGLMTPPVGPLPHRRWEWLAGQCKAHGWQCTDLTPALTTAATEALKQGRMLFWRDDTHWAPEGIAVAARVVAGRIQSKGGKQP